MTTDIIAGDWLANLLGCSLPPEGGSVRLGGLDHHMINGILRQQGLLSERQDQTRSAFGYKWARRDTYDSPAVRERATVWLRERYGDIDALLPAEATVLDAGCGAGFSASLMLAEAARRIHYLGVDVSNAVDVAARRFHELGFPGQFLQADLMSLPFPEASFDVVLSEGVLHHSDSTERAIAALTPLVKPGGRFMFYVYRTKSVIREFTDDYIRDLLQGIPEDEAWNRLIPLTKLGVALGELGVEVEVPEAIDLLGIPAGRINLQRLFYWHIFKAYFAPDMTIDEMNHINFDWYTPRNAHRQTPEQVRAWCAACGLIIEREVLEEAGITVIARRDQ